MAVHKAKRSNPLAQPPRRRPPHRSAKRKTRKPKRRFPALPKPIITKRGKTTIRRYDSRRFYRFEEAKGKPVDYIEVFTCGEYHSLDVRFQDKTTMHFVIEPCFILETEYSDWKTGNWRPIKKWPLIRSASFNS
ncbi:MAG: hypothetical protein LAO20_06610 [Acidobacteriia bacterium]|nr:hypothetical protein [Terriglobia bacterium]